MIGTYRNGTVSLDRPVEWPDGAQVEVSFVARDEEDDVCLNGTQWPRTDEEIEQWSQEIESFPPLYDDPEDLARFQRYLAESRQIQKDMAREQWEVLDRLFE